jgi:hypothetical protein
MRSPPSWLAGFGAAGISLASALDSRRQLPRRYAGEPVGAVRCMMIVSHLAGIERGYDKHKSAMPIASSVDGTVLLRRVVDRQDVAVPRGDGRQELEGLW